MEDLSLQIGVMRAGPIESGAGTWAYSCSWRLIWQTTPAAARTMQQHGTASLRGSCGWLQGVDKGKERGAAFMLCVYIFKILFLGRQGGSVS